MEVVIDNVFDESPKLTYRIRSRDPLDQVPEGVEPQVEDDTMEEESHTRTGSEGDMPSGRRDTAGKLYTYTLRVRYVFRRLKPEQLDWEHSTPVKYMHTRTRTCT